LLICGWIHATNGDIKWSKNWCHQKGTKEEWAAGWCMRKREEEGDIACSYMHSCIGVKE
jgi:hypothetical protein